MRKQKLKYPILTTISVLDDTLGYCPNCDKVTECVIIEEEGKVFLEKNCCGERILLEKDVNFFRKMRLRFKETEEWMNKFLTLEELEEELLNSTTFLCLYITGKCNLDCPICYLKHAKCFYGREPPFEEISKFLERREKSIILFMGAEPTMREDLFDLIKVAKRRGHVVMIFTNGIKLADEEYVRGLKEAGIDEIFFTLDGFDDRIIKELRGLPLMRTRMKALENLKKLRIKTIIAMPIKKNLNEGEISKLFNFVVSNKDFVDGVYIEGVWLPDEENELQPTVTISEICKILSANLNIDETYFHEVRRFKLNIYRLLSKILGSKHRKNFTLFRGDASYFIIHDGKILPLFSIRELKEVNEVIENSLTHRKKIKVLISLLRGFRPLWKIMRKIPPKLMIVGILSRFNQVKMYRTYIKTGIFRILTGELVGFRNLDLSRRPSCWNFSFSIYSPEATLTPQ